MTPHHPRPPQQTPRHVGLAHFRASAGYIGATRSRHRRKMEMAAAHRPRRVWRELISLDIKAMRYCCLGTSAAYPVALFRLRYCEIWLMSLMNGAVRPCGVDEMRKLIMAVTMAAVVFGLQAAAGAADLGVTYNGAPSARVVAEPRCPRQWVCGPAGCGWQRLCRVGCPDGYSCSPLYGAYGPYGGTGYWGAYTSVGGDSSYYR